MDRAFGNFSTATSKSIAPVASLHYVYVLCSRILMSFIFQNFLEISNESIRSHYFLNYLCAFSKGLCSSVKLFLGVFLA